MAYRKPRKSHMEFLHNQGHVFRTMLQEALFQLFFCLLIVDNLAKRICLQHSYPTTTGTKPFRTMVALMPKPKTVNPEVDHYGSLPSVPYHDPENHNHSTGSASKPRQRENI